MFIFMCHIYNLKPPSTTSVCNRSSESVNISFSISTCVLFQVVTRQFSLCFFVSAEWNGFPRWAHNGFVFNP